MRSSGEILGGPWPEVAGVGVLPVADGLLGYAFCGELPVAVTLPLAPAVSICAAMDADGPPGLPGEAAAPPVAEGPSSKACHRE